MATAAELQVRDRVFIGGEWVEPSGARARSRSSTRPPRRSMGTIPALLGRRTPTARCAAARDAFDVAGRRPRARSAPATWRRSPPGSASAAEEIAATIAQELGMPLKLSRMIQAGPADHASSRSMPQLMEEVAWEEEIGNSRVAARAGRRARRDHALELPAEPDRRQGRPRPRRRLHGGAEAERGRRR